MRVKVLIFDSILAVLTSLILLGGMTWGDRIILSHAPDLRRAMLLVGLAGIYFIPKFAEKSVFLGTVLVFLKNLEVKKFRWIFFAMVAALALLVSVSQAQALRFPLYDVGIYHQIIWNIAHGNAFWSTISGAGNYLMDHFSITYALIVPFFYLSNYSPLVLPVLNAFLLFGGLAAWIYFAEQHSKKLAAAATIVAVSFESVWGNLHWGFHDTGIAFCALSWAFAFVFLGRHRIWAVVLFLIAALSKELIFVDVAVVFAVLGLERWKSSKLNSALYGISALLFIGFFLKFESMPHPADKNYFVRYYSYLGNNLGDFFKSFFLAPQKIVDSVGAIEIIKFVLNVFLPWLFIPVIFLFKKFPKNDRFYFLLLLSIIPPFLASALATYVPLRGMGFHYVLVIWPVLAIFPISVLAKLNKDKWIWTWAFVGLLLMGNDPFGAFKAFQKDAKRLRYAREYIQNIPTDLSVVADELAGPFIAGRKTVTRWFDTRFHTNACPDLILLREPLSAEGQARLDSLTKECHKSSDPIWKSEEWVAYR